MQRGGNIIALGIAIAIGACVTLALLGENPWLAFGAALIWVGTIWLVGLDPAHNGPDPKTDHASRSSASDLIEHLASPTLLTKNGLIVAASHSARKVLGGHIIGQDARVVLRQPEAIAMLAGHGGGEALIHGLVRRRDSWRVTRTPLSERTALIELSNQTAEADMARAHSDFVANASHELRTPLAAIIGYSETLEDAAEGGAINQANTARFTGIILREAQRMQSLISDLMSLSRIEAERHGLPSERVHLAPLITNAAHDAAGPERDERIRIAIEEEPEILGDNQQIEQLVRNLVDNSLKYGDYDTPVSINLAINATDQAVITVADQGKGIPADHLPHLTRRFYRTDPGRSRASGGTGLGLAIVKHIVERHRGRLDIASTLGEGTTVTVRLPLASTAR